MIPLNETCTCGRTWVHCRRCGSMSIYVLKNKSLMASALAREDVEVFTCKVCTHTSKSTDTCKAPSGLQQEQRKKMTKLMDQGVEVEPGVEFLVRKPKREAEPSQETISLAELIGRSNPEGKEDEKT